MVIDAEAYIYIAVHQSPHPAFLCLLDLFYCMQCIYEILNYTVEKKHAKKIRKKEEGNDERKEQEQIEISETG